MILSNQIYLFISVVIGSVASAGLKEEFSWSRLTYRWPQEGEEGAQLALSVMKGRSGRGAGVDPTAIIFDGSTNADSKTKPISAETNVNGPGNIDYQYINNIPMGANVWQDKLFVTVPRRRLGVPSTLNYVPIKSPQKHNVPLIPYPTWDHNVFSPDDGRTTGNIVSVYRVAIDVCDRLWMVDTGVVETVGNRTVIKPHQLIIINLQNDQVIHRYDLPDNVMTPATTLASVTVDTPKGSCGNAFAYFPDLAGYGLIVYSLNEDKAWRVNHNYFFVEPLAGDLAIAGYKFQWNDGVFSVELTDIKPNGYRDMYFHSLAGTHMYKVSTRVLRNESLATRSFHEDDFTVVGDRGENSQTSTADIHKPTGIMFLALVNQNAVGCWNTRHSLRTLSIVARDDEKMIYPSDVKIFADKVYVLTNTMPGFLYGRLNYDRTNFRVWSSDVRKAVEGTKCQSGRENV